MRVARLFASVAAATAAGLALATPAMADSTTVPIHSSQVPTTAAKFDGKTCTSPFDKLPANTDGWHFVTTGQASFTSVTLKFHTSGGDVTVLITGTKVSPSTGPGWSGYLDNAGDAEKHAYLFATAGWELFEGSAVVENADEKDQFFNLSHTCAGKSSGSSPSPNTPGSSSPSPGGGGNLPKTGSATGVIVLGGIVLVAGGVALLAIRRRRELHDN